MPTHVRLQIAGQLKQGVSFDSVLDKVRDNVGSQLERVHLLTIDNIKSVLRRVLNSMYKVHNKHFDLNTSPFTHKHLRIQAVKTTLLIVFIALSTSRANY